MGSLAEVLIDAKTRVVDKTQKTIRDWQKQREINKYGQVFCGKLLKCDMAGDYEDQVMQLDAAAGLCQRKGWEAGTLLVAAMNSIGQGPVTPREAEIGREFYMKWLADPSPTMVKSPATEKAIADQSQKEGLVPARAIGAFSFLYSVRGVMVKRV